MEILASAQSTIEAAGRTAARVATRVAQVPSALKTVVQDTVDLSTAQAATKAGVAVLRTAREMLGTIVDLFA
jgi:formiminotetrahydrofolate cyclodeaminase